MAYRSSDPSRERITELTLFVRTSSEEVIPWNRDRIVEALLRETSLDDTSAVEISREIEEFVLRSGMNHVTTPLIRELVDTKLIERGLEGIYRRHRRLGVPVYDVENLILHSGKENANIPHSPEASNHLLAELIKKEYALDAVFSPEVRDAHIKGDIHIHGLGFIDRPYSTYQSLEGLKRKGLTLTLPPVSAGPARHPDALLSQMIRFSSLLQAHYAASIGWHGVNISFAPYLKGMGYREIKQLAQRMVFEFSQLGAGRGGQAIFSGIHIYLHIPESMKDLEAVGPGGRVCDTYGDYRKEARDLARALLETYREGDGYGRPLFFPQPWFHISEEALKDKGLMDLLLETCQTKGTPHIFLERDGYPAPFPVRKGPFPSSSTLQNVSINLPRIGYIVARGGDLMKELERVVLLALKAHVEKREFLRRLAAKGKEGPLGFIVDSTLFDVEGAKALIGMVGLPELAGSLFAGEDGLEASMRFIKTLRKTVKEKGKVLGIDAILTQTPGESTVHRFAKLDLKHFSPLSGRVVQGDLAEGEIYYNTSLLPVSTEIDPFERVKREGLLHPLIDGEVFTNLYLKGSSLGKDFIHKALQETKNRLISISPDFFFCRVCNITVEGRERECPSCNSRDIEIISRVTTYYSILSNWNRGKVGEWKERFRWGWKRS